MRDLYDRGEKIDRVTVANELMKQGQLESVDGLSYLVSLDDGLPQIANLDSYIRIVKDKAMLRKLIFSVAEDDRPLPDRRGGAGRDSGGRRRNAAEAGRGARRASSCESPARSSRSSRAASTRSSIPASASAASAPASRSSTR